MKKLFLFTAAAMLLALPSHSKAQDSDLGRQISVPEFRQALMDLGSYLDARKGTDIQRQFEAIPEDILEKMLASVAEPRKFQSATASLKNSLENPEALSLGRRSRTRPGFSPMTSSPYPNCPADTIIDTSASATCTPAYPDPNNGAWDAMANALIGIGAFSPNDLTDASSQGCGLTTEVTLQQVTVVLTGLEQSLTPVCSIIPAPFNAVCFGALTAVCVADAVSAGLFQDCIEQDGLVNGAEVDAGFHNTVTIYDSLGNVASTVGTINNNLDSDFSALTTQITGVNTNVTNVGTGLATDITNTQTTLATDITNTQTALSNQITARSNQIDTEIATLSALALRMAIEANLASNASAVVGLFAVPSAEGGYLETTMSIVTDVVNKMSSLNLNMTSANKALSLANGAYALKNYTACFQKLKQAYQSAVVLF